MLQNKYDNFGKFLEDFKVGEVYKHNDKKIITREDNNLFCQITMNHHPLHLDTEFAESTIYKKIIVAGTFVASITVGLSVSDISGKAIANLDYEKIIHHAPVFIGDTLQAETEILKVRKSRSKPDRGIIFVETRTFNQKNEKVLSLRRHILIPKRGKK
jgi:acyl dehydratase